MSDNNPPWDTEQLKQVLDDLRKLGAIGSVNFFSGGVNTVIIAEHYHSFGSGKKPRRKQAAQPEPEVEVHEDELDDEGQLDSLEPASERDQEPPRGERYVVGGKDDEAYLKVLAHQDLLVYGEDITAEMISAADCAQEILDAANPDELDDILERHFPETDA